MIIKDWGSSDDYKDGGSSDVKIGEVVMIIKDWGSSDDYKRLGK